jgi:hypothetical protein
MSRSLKRHYPVNLDLQAKLQFSITCCDPMDLPSYDETKKMTCPGHTTVKDVLTFADGKIHFKDHIIYHP